jgi:acetylglutamate kinase
MVIVIPGAVIRNSGCLQKFVEAVAQFVQDGHWITVVQGDEGEAVGRSNWSQFHASGSNSQAGNGTNGASTSMFDKVANTGRLLAAHLAILKVCGLAMVASDADLCRLRKRPGKESRNSGAEICSVNTRWLDIICSHKGVPVISNIALSAWGESYSLDLNHLAAKCAIHWNADSLTYLTDEAGVTDHQGDVIRWFDVRDVERLSAGCQAQDMVARLKTCKEALEGGVHRVRMMPVSAVEHLSSFYSAKIDYGTEVIAASGLRAMRAVPQKAKSFSRGHQQ